MKKFFQGICALAIGTVLSCSAYFAFTSGMINVAAAEQTQELSVRFGTEYPEVGKELEVRVEGLNADEEYGCIWMVNDKIVHQWETYTPSASDLEKFIKVEVRTTEGRSAEYKVYFSKLPVVYIDTNGLPIKDKENYVKGSMYIQGNEKYNSENSTLYDGGLEIRGRGNSSWEAPKKPYRLKLSSKANIFGMGANKHWTLLANYYDPSLSRNKLSYDFSGELGLVSMASENVVLIMNDSYQGVYQLCEHIRVDKNRIDITDWEKVAEDTAEVIAEAESSIDAGNLEDYLVENMAWITSGNFTFEGTTYNLENYGVELPEIDGGYLLELDKNLDEVSNFYTSKKQPLMFKSPEYVKTNSDMMNYVRNYINAFEKAIDTADGYTTYMGKEMHYSELYDVDALAQYFLVTELFFNVDGMKKSTYLYKDNGEPVKMGPIWDMDWCAGSPYEQVTPADRWQTLFYDDEGVRDQWYRSIIGDPYFAYKVKHFYDEYRTSIESFVAAGGCIDKNIEYMKEAGAKNDAKWTSQTSTFLKNSENLKKWMTQRISWLDRQMVSVDSLLASWEAFESNQNDGEVVKIENILSEKEGIKISVHTESDENVGIYINGIKYAQEASANGRVEAVIPYENLKDQAAEEIFVVVRTMKQGNVCTDYTVANVQIPEPEPKPEPSVKPVTEVFSDVVQGEWYVEKIQYVYDKGLMSGSNGLFRPTENVKRSQVAVTLYMLAGGPEVTDFSALENFVDVTSDAYYAKALCWAYENDVIKGTGEGNKFFKGSDDVKRQQLAAMFYRYAECMGYSTEERADLSTLVNADKVSDYTRESVEWAVGAGLISGSRGMDQNGNIIYDLKPLDTATRAQLATILQKFCDINHI